MRIVLTSMAAGRTLLRLGLLPFGLAWCWDCQCACCFRVLAIRTAAEGELAGSDEKQTIPYDLRQVLPGPVSVCIHSSSFDGNRNLGCVERGLQEMDGHHQ